MIERIEFFARWIGFANPSSSAEKLVIEPRDGRFFRQQFPIGDATEVPNASVNQLAVALSQSFATYLDPKLFDLPEDFVKWHFGSCWTSDYPSLLVKITFATGQNLEIRTEAQHAFMLPLTVTETAVNESHMTFDPALSIAISGLMPDGFLFKNRLNAYGGYLEFDLAHWHSSREQSSEDPECSNESGDDSALCANDECFQAIIEKIFSKEETPEEKVAAEQSGRVSERLLKRIRICDVRELLASGADPNIADDVGQTALMHAAFPPFDEVRFWLLVRAGADLNTFRNEGSTGLHIACAGGEPVAAAEWVKAGANIHLRTRQGSTPLMLGVNYCEIVRLLIAAGSDIDATDSDGHSAISYAILGPMYSPEKTLESIRILIKAETDLNQRDCKGLTAFGHARQALARIMVEENVVSLLSPELEIDPTERQTAETIVNFIASAGGEE